MLMWIRQDEIQVGDVIFGFFGDELQDEAIADIQLGFDDERMNHCALVVSDTEVIEAVLSGVRRLSIDRFLRRHRRRGRILVARPGRTDLIADSVAVAETFIGFGYNHKFVASPGELYCSELIVEAFEQAAGGERLFKQYDLVFGADGEPVPEYWVEYYRKFGMEVPSGQGTHPASLSCDEFFTERYWYLEEAK